MSNEQEPLSAPVGSRVWLVQIHNRYGDFLSVHASWEGAWGAIRAYADQRLMAQEVPDEEAIERCFAENNEWYEIESHTVEP